MTFFAPVKRLPVPCRHSILMVLSILFSCSSACVLSAAPLAPALAVDFSAAPLGPYTNQQVSQDWVAARWASLHGRATVVADPIQRHVLRLEYPLDGVGPGQTGGQFEVALSPASEYVLSYKVLFEDGFDFRLGGKLPGLTSGGSTFTGGNHPDSGEGWSARFMWRKGGALEIYLYYIDMTKKWGEQLPLEGIVATTGQWIELKQRIRVNSPGRKDALIQVWVDGELVLDHTNFRLRTAPLGLVDSFYFSTFHGGSGPKWGPLNDSFARFDDFRISVPHQ